MTIKVSVICNAEATRAALVAADAASIGAVLTVRTGSAQSLASVLRRDQPDVLLLDLPLADEAAMEQIEAALMRSPGTHLVLVSADSSLELLKRAMRAGVRELLPAPLSLMTVQRALKHAQTNQSHRSREPDVAGQVLALIPAKGGAGATFLATNLAYALSRQGKRVAVIDLNLYFGDAAIFLGDKKIVSSVVDLARQMERLDSALLHSSMIKLSENLHLLAASELPEDVNEVSTAGVEKIIELARSHYDFVLLDVSSTLDPVAIKALDLADTICLALQLNLPFIRAATHMAAVFRELGYSSDKLSVIVNRYEKGGSINLGDVEKATQLQIGRTIPNGHLAVTASVNQGVPLLEMAPRDPVARALLAWAQELAPTAVQRSSGWWRGLVKSSA